MEGAKFEVAQQLSLKDGYIIPNATKTPGAGPLTKALTLALALTSRARDYVTVSGTVYDLRPIKTALHVSDWPDAKHAWLRLCGRGLHSVLFLRLTAFGSCMASTTDRSRPYPPRCLLTRCLFIRADHLITGQNHASARLVTDMVIEDTSFGVRLTP